MKSNNRIKKVLLRIFIIISISVLISAESCEDRNDNIIGQEDYRFILSNNSEKSVYIDFGVTYPDTAIGNYRVTNDSLLYKIDPRQSKRIMIPCCWESFFSSQISSDTLMVFIFDAEAIENITWDEIKEDYVILHRYDLTLEDLISLDWTITYP